MEKELIALKKELYELDNIEGDVWKYVNDWERKFCATIGGYGSRYNWCLNEFDNIETLNEGNFPEDSFRGRIVIKSCI